jgi:hypothetical protein
MNRAQGIQIKRLVPGGRLSHQGGFLPFRHRDAMVQCAKSGHSPERGSVHGRGVISAESAVEKLADPAVELGWSPRRAF